MIAALYVHRGGVYYGIDDVDPWDKDRDARLYAGPWPVVAHPPCERWGNYWYGGPSWTRRRLPPKRKGDDGGCFAAALDAVRKWGGVLEHPAQSHAWQAFDLVAPPHSGGWTVADFCGGWTCRIEQGHYGHRARKPTWLYAVGIDPPSLPWGSSAGVVLLHPAMATVSDRWRARAKRDGINVLLSRKQRAATPIAFRDALLSMARSVKRRAA